MAKLIVEGGRPLKGVVRLGGAKNASFKLMIASLLAKGESRLLNFSRIADVDITKKIIESLGAEVKRCGERTLFINSSRIITSIVPKELGLASRASILFIAPLLARLKRAVVPLPGGDKIGKRPVERHLAGLKALGARIKFSKGMFEVSAARLQGAYFKFPKNTHTGTEALIMAGVLAQGKTILDNAAQEPEVDDLIVFLNQMGAKIKRVKPRKIEIEGVPDLSPVIYQIMPDRNEAVSYAIAALATRGDIVVENAVKGHLEAFLEQLKKAGGGFEVGNYGIRFFYQGRLRGTDIITEPHPKFMTDWQPLWSVLATQSRGKSLIIEAVSLDRFQYVPYLQEMGAKIEFIHPTPEEPESFFNFNLEDDDSEIFHGIQIQGKTPLKAVKARVTDLRAGATLLLAGLVAKGETVLTEVEHIDRGYEDLDGRLVELGAKIKRID